ncbi:MAG: UDP-glucose 6-dehydrogenase [Pelagibacterales bacterium]|nr:UDP-glucose 6-dehydrogenase [Pelagibacterales bacterium]|tara:strand:+ start:5782 stop:7149 length:1368 start_codon:yes stop_codon:yes gene_type:complete
MKTINVTCIGAGYVGGPSMAVFAENCPDIKFTIVDKNSEKIKAWNGDINNLPIYEPGLKEIIEKTRDKNLFFSTDIDEAILNAEIIFIAVNTPTLTEGPGAGFGADLRYIISCAEHIAKVAKSDKIIVEKSTVPIKTAEKLTEVLSKNNSKINFEILSNPEFLAEGTAIEDLRNPDRVLIGGNNSKSGQIAVKTLVDIYSNWVKKEKIITTNLWSSELSKLASNAMLAQRISSINSLSALCDKTGADINEVSKAISLDHRIGKYFLNPSVGFGGSCFQKDILNLVYLCRNYGLNEVAEYWHQVVKMNNYQRSRFSKKIISKLGNNLTNKTITLYGWSFKKDTNDSRESSSIYIAIDLLNKGAKINVYDPQTSNEIILSDIKEYSSNQSNIIDRISFIDNPYKAAKNSSCVGILTEWDEFKLLNWKKIEKIMIDEKFIIDGRYMLKDIIKEKITYL